jgi:hypothetical protein
LPLVIIIHTFDGYVKNLFFNVISFYHLVRFRIFHWLSETFWDKMKMIDAGLCETYKDNNIYMTIWRKICAFATFERQTFCYLGRYPDSIRWEGTSESRFSIGMYHHRRRQNGKDIEVCYLLLVLMDAFGSKCLT